MVASYTGRTENADRQQAEDDLLANRVKALVATSALGMGFDKPDLGFVVHLGSPSSPIAYYQQVGRAGAEWSTPRCCCCPGKEDEAIWQYFASVAFPPEEQVRQTLDVLAQAGRPLSLPALEPLVDLRRTRLETMLKVLDVDGAVQAGEGRLDRPRASRGCTTPSGTPGWRGSGRPSSRPCATTRRRPGAVWSSCGASWTTRRPRPAAAVTTARARGSTTRSPRGRWTAARGELGRPGGGGGAAQDVADRARRGGRRPQGPYPGRRAGLPGRALGRLSDIGWGNRLRPLLAPQAPDGPVPDDVAKAVVAVLADWAQGPGRLGLGGSGRAPRPVGVVTVASRRRPQLVGSLGSRIAEVGRMPLLGTVDVRAGRERPAISRSNSAQRVRALHEASPCRPRWPRRSPRPRARPARGRPLRHRLDPRRRRPAAPPRGRRGGVPAGSRRPGMTRGHVTADPGAG